MLQVIFKCLQYTYYTNYSLMLRPETMKEENDVIDEQINFQMDEENNFNLEFEESENKSVEFDQSTVNFLKHGVVVNKFGAKGSQMNQVTIEINSDLIKEQRLIGKGAAGEVWLATYLKDGQEIDVAIKQIPVNHKQSRDQFVKDLMVFLTSDNPHVVKFYGCFYKEGYVSEVIEYMNLGSLRDIINFNIKNNFLKPTETILAELSRCILEGLYYIHKKKRQIHRDIKPQNILVNSSGEVKITDFGICKQLQKTFALSKTWVGTQIYMSPQRIQCGEYSSNCDVWSFGLVLYQLATSKQLPYKKRNGNEPVYLLMQKIKNSPVPTFDPEDNRSPQFINFLSRCLEKDPKNRANVQQLLQHPWLLSNSTGNILKDYIKMVWAKMKKEKKQQQQNK